jgi:hypothetical protein
MGSAQTAREVIGARKGHLIALGHPQVVRRQVHVEDRGAGRLPQRSGLGRDA